MYNYNKKYEKINNNSHNSKKYSTHKVCTNIVDNGTGEIIESYEIDVKQKQSKRGWCKMYKIDLQLAIQRLAKKQNALKVWTLLWDYNKKDGSIRMPKYDVICKKLNMDKTAVSKAIKILKDEELIMKIENEWRYNPFICGVSGQSDAELAEAQQLWEKEIGYYEFKDGKFKSKYIEEPSK